MLIQLHHHEQISWVIISSETRAALDFVDPLLTNVI